MAYKLIDAVVFAARSHVSGGQCIHRCHFDREYGQQAESAAKGPDRLAHVVIGFGRVIHDAA